MKVLITGGFGGLGVSMAEYLLKNTDYDIYLGHRLRTARLHFENDRIIPIPLDITDDTNVNDVFARILPDYLINFAGFVQVEPSWNCPQVAYDTNCLGVLRCLESIRKHKPECRFFSAGSICEYSDEVITENSIPNPKSIYGTSKNAAHNLVKVYREKYDLYAVHGILGNNESPYKKDGPVNKIIKGVCSIRKSYENGLIEPIIVGNLNARRAWGCARDFSAGIWRMINQPKEGKDYVIASEEFHTIKDVVEYACFAAGLPFEWRGRDLNEFAFIPPYEKNRFLEVSAEFFRAETLRSRASSELIKKELGWEPKTDFRNLIKNLVEFQLSRS